MQYNLNLIVTFVNTNHKVFSFATYENENL